MREEVFEKYVDVPPELLEMPTSGQATYSGGVGIVYNDKDSDVSILSDPSAVPMIGEMNMTANFTAAGGDVEGRLSGFYAGDFDVAWTGNDAEQWTDAMYSGDMHMMTPAEREAMIAAFDTPVEGELTFGGDIAPGSFAIDISGTLDNDGKSVVVGGQGLVNFGQGDAEIANINGATHSNLTLTEDGVDKTGRMRGFAVKDD
ncbi:MAG: hypothetical protein CR993_01125 [Rhodobacterales bacterium]|nr:MAG: hypothetical protein CR993_01125 [Rhodobacterales bacterium]